MKNMAKKRNFRCIEAIREDERKTLLDYFSSRLDVLASKIIREKMDYAEIHLLLVDESVHFSSLAAGLNNI